jgi:hypothetical protein
LRGTRQRALCRVPEIKHSAKNMALGKEPNSGSDVAYAHCVCHLNLCIISKRNLYFVHWPNIRRKTILLKETFALFTYVAYTMSFRSLFLVLLKACEILSNNLCAFTTHRHRVHKSMCYNLHVHMFPFSSSTWELRIDSTASVVLMQL